MEVLIDMWKLRRAHTDMGGAGMDECHCLIRASALHHHLRIETVRSRRAYISTYPPSYPPWLRCLSGVRHSFRECAILLACSQQRVPSQPPIVSLASQPGYAAPFDASPYLFTASDRSHQICSSSVI